MSEVVDAYWSVESVARSAIILPDGCVDVVQREGVLRVVGPMTRARTIGRSAHPIAGIRFLPGAVRAWLGVSPRELLDDVVEGREIAALASARTLADVLRMCRPATPRRGLAYAVNQLRRAPATSVALLAETIGMSARQLQRLFVEEVGLSPKRFARVQRLQVLVGPWRDQRSMPLRRAAFEAGYADQAHMGREVRALCGMTPVALRAAMSDSFKTHPTR